MEQSSSSESSRIKSSLAGEAAFRPLLEMYVAGFPEAMRGLASAILANNPVAAQTIAHRLRGSGTSYGFEEITRAAGLCDEAVRGGAEWKVHAQGLWDVLARCEL